MGLLTADLRSLGNAVTRREGRRVAIAFAVMLGMLALMSWMVAATLLEQPALLTQLRFDMRGGSLHGLLGAGLMPCTITAGWLGLALGQRQLFEAPELPLWQAAPIAAWRPALQVLWRATFQAVLWSLALTLPFVATLLARAGAPALAWALVPLAILLCTMPLLCTVLALNILLVLLFAGRALQIVLTVLAALASFGFSAFLLIGLFAPGSAQARLAETAASPGGLPWTVATAADLLSSAATGGFPTSTTLTAAAWLGTALLVFLLVAHVHPAAVERQLRSQRPALQLHRRTWPTGLAASIRRKELTQLLQQPSALLGMLVFGALVFALAREQVLIRGILADPRLPRGMAQVGAMLALWFLAVLLVLYAHMGRLAMWDGPQWSLYLSAPARPATILRGKLQAVALLLLWPVVVVGTVGSNVLGAGPPALLTFLGIALAGNFVALGTVAWVGTSPRLLRPDAGGQITQSSRSFLAAMALVLLFELAVSPGFFAWMWCSDQVRLSRSPEAEVERLLPWSMLAAWSVALLLGGSGCWLGARNYARLLQPQ